MAVVKVVILGTAGEGEDSIGGPRGLKTAMKVESFPHAEEGEGEHTREVHVRPEDGTGQS